MRSTTSASGRSAADLRRRRLLAITTSLAVVSAASAASTVVATPASATDPCTTPQLSDVMISQGLPTYGMLAYGKTTLVKLFLSTPSCLPVGASVTVTGAQLQVSSSSAPIQLAASLPLPPLGPSTTAPVPASASDILFVVPGSALKPVTSPVTFSARVDYVVRTSAGTVADTVGFATAPGTTNALSAAVAPDVLPAGVLVVPMGNGAAGAATQFPQEARAALQTGMTALTRLLPVADSGGLSYRLSAGMLDVGRFMSNNVYCGQSTHLTFISKELDALRVAWNSISGNTRAQTALGQVWQGISSGPNTHSGSSCAEGYAQLPGTAGWGRTIATSLQGNTTLQPVPVTGTLAAHELMHNVGGVSDFRNDRTSHSKNTSADVTAPNRAYNIYSQRWLQDNKTVTNYMTSKWHDGNSLYEKEDWDWMQCSLQPLPTNPVTGEQCDAPGQLTFAGAAPPGETTFVVTGSTDGTPAGTDAYSYASTDNRVDPTDPSSEYRFIEKDVDGGVLRDVGVPVHGTFSHVDDGQAPPPGGSFGIAVAAHPSTARLELVRVAAGASQVLYSRDRNAPPRLVSAHVGGRSITVSALDEHPEQLRLDLFLSCPAGTSPLVTGSRPTVIAGVAVFVTDYDTSLGCPSGTLVSRVTDGFSATSSDHATPAMGTDLGTATIDTPHADTVLTSFENLAVAGAGRDELGAEASRLTWSLTGPTRAPDVDGATATFVPPETGFAAGDYTVTLRAFSGTRQFATATRAVRILSDRDKDRIPDDQENQPCFGAGAADDPSNALIDSDGDGYANVVDADPCHSANTVTAIFHPDSLFKTSSGVPVTVHLDDSTVDLRTLGADDLYITQIAGFATANLLSSPTALRAISYNATSATAATVKFDRGVLSQALQLRPSLVGYVPLFVGTLDGAVRGADPTSPRVFP